ncbi:MAG: hypothetical protein PHX21_01005 [bacterium]|nr:hypothetical protein [bacterium]
MNILPKLQEQYHIKVTPYNVDTDAGMAYLNTVEKDYNEYVKDWPGMFIHEKLNNTLTKNFMLSGKDAIKEMNWDSLTTNTPPDGTSRSDSDSTIRDTTSPMKHTVTTTTVITQTSQPKTVPATKEPKSDSVKAITATIDKSIIVYFYKTGCSECSRVEHTLKRISEKFKDVEIKRFNIADSQSILLYETLSKKYKVPEKLILVTPALFLADTFFIEIVKELEVNEVIEQKKSWKSPAEQEPSDSIQTPVDAKQSIIDRFKKFSLLSIVAAGLVDSVNPCAFATLIFLISYLAYVEYKRKNILWCGLSFTLAVFITYFLIGIGLLRLAIHMESFILLSKIIYYAIAAFAFIIGCINLYDYWLCRKGRATDMALQLPDYIKKTIHFMIRDKLSIERHPAILYATAFVVGVIISILETICTGQVYLPTITYIIGVPALKVKAIFYLLIYNLLFVAPLVFIFIFVYWGMSSKRLGALMNKNLAPVKLATAIVLFALCALMLILK